MTFYCLSHCHLRFRLKEKDLSSSEGKNPIQYQHLSPVPYLKFQEWVKLVRMYKLKSDLELAASTVRAKKQLCVAMGFPSLLYPRNITKINYVRAFSRQLLHCIRKKHIGWFQLASWIKIDLRTPFVPSQDSATNRDMKRSVTVSL